MILNFKSFLNLYEDCYIVVYTRSFLYFLLFWQYERISLNQLLLHLEYCSRHNNLSVVSLEIFNRSIFNNCFINLVVIENRFIVLNKLSISKYDFLRLSRIINTGSNFGSKISSKVNWRKHGF